MKNLKLITSFLFGALFAFGSATLCLGAVDFATALSDAPTHFVQYAPIVGAGAFGLSLTNILPQGSLLNSPIVSGLTAFAGKYSRDLIGQLYGSLDTSELTIDTDATSTKVYPKLSIAGGVVAYDPAYNPGDDLSYSDRKLIPALAKRELRIEPKKYFNTYLQYIAGLKSNGALDRAIPFESFVWQKVIEQVVSDITKKMVGNGDTASSDLTKKITNGFLKIVSADLAANLYTPIATGAWTAANAVTKSEDMYQGVTEEWQEVPLNMYMSRAMFQKWILSYRALYPYDGAAYSNPSKPELYVPISGGMCKLVPSLWMTGSNRVIIAPKANLIVGGGLSAETSQVQAVQNVWTIDAGISFTLGMCIRDTQAIWVNDQA